MKWCRGRYTAWKPFMSFYHGFFFLPWPIVVNERPRAKMSVDWAERSSLSSSCRPTGASRREWECARGNERKTNSSNARADRIESIAVDLFDVHVCLCIFTRFHGSFMKFTLQINRHIHTHSLYLSLRQLALSHVRSIITAESYFFFFFTFSILLYGSCVCVFMSLFTFYFTCVFYFCCELLLLLLAAVHAYTYSFASIAHTAYYLFFSIVI